MLQNLPSYLKLHPFTRLIVIILTAILTIAVISLGLWYLFKPTPPVAIDPEADNLVAKLNGTNLQNLEFKAALDPQIFYYNTINKDNWLLHVPTQSSNKTYIQPILSAIKAPETSAQGYYPVIYNTVTKSYTLAKDFQGDRIIGKTAIGIQYDKDRSEQQLDKLIDTGKYWIYSLTDGSIFASEPGFTNAKILIEQIYSLKDRYTITQLLDIRDGKIALTARRESIQSLVDKVAVNVNSASSNSQSVSYEFQDPKMYVNTIIYLPLDKTMGGDWKKSGEGLSSIWTTVELTGASAWQQQGQSDYQKLLEEFKLAAAINKLTPTRSKSNSSQADSGQSRSSVAPLPARPEEYYQDNYIRVDWLASGRMFLHIAGAKNYIWLIDGQTGANINQNFGIKQQWDEVITSNCDITKSLCKIVNLSDSTVYTLDASGAGGEHTFGSKKLEVKDLDIKAMDYTTRYRVRMLRESLVNRGGQFGFWQLGRFMVLE